MSHRTSVFLLSLIPSYTPNDFSCRRQIAACNRRWQLELPQRGAVSLAEQHHLQPSTSSDDIDGVASTSSMSSVSQSMPSLDDEAMTAQKQADRLAKMMACQLSLPPGSAGWSSGSVSAGGKEAAAADSPTQTHTDGFGDKHTHGPPIASGSSTASSTGGFSFKSPSSGGWAFQGSPPAWTSGSQLFTFSVGVAGPAGATAAQNAGAARVVGDGLGDSASRGVSDSPARPQAFVFRAGGRTKH